MTMRPKERSVGKVRKKLPIGIENFEEFSVEDFYYVDKTLFIKELLQNWGKANLFTRPRRFGDYYGAVEPPVRQSQSHSSDGTEPL